MGGGEGERDAIYFSVSFPPFIQDRLSLTIFSSMFILRYELSDMSLVSNPQRYTQDNFELLYSNI